jgi:hypothetical protein
MPTDQASIEPAFQTSDCSNIPASEMTVDDQKAQRSFPPNRRKPARCLLYPRCIARPCRLSSHRHYGVQRPSGFRRPEATTAHAKNREMQMLRLNSPLASIGNPDNDPFIKYPFDLTPELQEIVKLGQSSPCLHFPVAMPIASLWMLL